MEGRLEISRRACWGILFLIAVVILEGATVTTLAQLSGRFGLDLVARRIPTTLTGEIELDTPSEFAMLEFAISSNLTLDANFGFVDLNIDAVVNMAGPEHLVLKTPVSFGDVPLYGIQFDTLSVVPEIWFAVPFESVTDVNNLPNSQVIPPGDPLFVKARLTCSMSIAGFDVKHLVMLEDVNFPDPGESFDPLFYPVQSQSFAVGSLTTISWQAVCGVSVSANIGISAAAGSNNVKGYSASGRVDPGHSYATLSISGIHCGSVEVPLGFISLNPYDVQFGFSLSVIPTGTLPFSAAVSVSGKFSEAVSFSTSLSFTPSSKTLGDIALYLSVSCGPFSLSVDLETLAINAFSVNFNTSLNLGAMTGAFKATMSAKGDELSSIHMSLNVSEGILSAGTSVAFTRSSAGFGFASLGGTLTFRFSPAVVTVQATFGRYGLTRASVSTGVVF